MIYRPNRGQYLHGWQISTPA